MTTLISAGEDRAEAIAIQPDGKIVLAGHKNSGAGNNDFAVVRYNVNGSLDTSFNPGGGFVGPPNLAGMVTTAVTGANDELEGVASQSNGKIVVAGFAGFSVAGTMHYAVARFNSNGNLYTTGSNAPTGFFVSSDPTDGNPPELLQEVARRLPAILGVFGQAGPYHPIERKWHERLKRGIGGGLCLRMAAIRLAELFPENAFRPEAIS